MRIALYHNLPSGGAKRTLNESTRKLATRHHIDVFTLASANHEFADVRPYVVNHFVFPFEARHLLDSPFGRLNQLLRFLDLRTLNKMARFIAQEIDRGNYDVVLVHPCQFEKSPSILSYLKTPSVYYCQEPLRQLYEPAPFRPYNGDESARRQWLNRIDPLPPLYFNTLKRNDRRNTRSAGKVLVNSKFIQSSMTQIYGVDTAVSYHGIDADLFHPMQIEKGNFVLSVGSLTPLKGFDFIIEGLAKLPSTSRPPLIIVSNFQNPPEKAYLEALAARLKVSLQLLTNISDEKLVELYNRAKLVAYTPLREPFGLVALEAMACSTPVVAVRDGGISETIVDGRTGTLVSRDATEFANAVSALLDNPSMAKDFGINGRTHILKHWTWERAAQTLESHLVAVTEKSPLMSIMAA